MTARARRSVRWRGFWSLVAVLLVVGVGRACAPGYVMRQRAAFARDVIGLIRLREEQYRAVHYRYLELPWSTESVPSEPTAIPVDGPWAELGSMDEEPTYFRYRVLVTGPGPGFSPLNIIGVPATDFAFVVQAEADLDGDGRRMVVEGYSESSNLFESEGVGGPPLDEGWE